MPSSRSFTVAPGSGYSLTPGASPPEWDLTLASCDDGSPLANINAAPGETVTCFFQHRQWGRVVAVLDARPDSPQEFSYTTGGGFAATNFTLSDPSPGNTASRSRALSRVPPGNGYWIAQAAQPGWTLSSATCNNGSPVYSINVPYESVVTCTFVNVPTPPG